MSETAHTPEIAASSVNNDSRSSEDILAEYQTTRSEHLFEQLHARHRNDVHDFLTRYLGDFHDAEEVTQQVFLRIHQRPQSYRPGRRISPWLMAIAHNEAVDFREMQNAKKRCDEGRIFSLSCTSSDESRDSLAAELPDQREPMPDEEVALREILGELHQCMANLRECDRDVIRLVHLRGMSHRQTAEVLGIPEGTVRSRNRRGLSMLRDMLGDERENKESAA